MQKRKPTEKQKRFVENTSKGMSMRKAALEAGYSENTADNARTEILEKAGTMSYKEELQSKLKEKIGIDALIKVFADAIVADKADITGSVRADHRIRVDAATKVTTLLDADGTKKVDVTSKGEKVGGLFSNLDDLPDDSTLKQFILAKKK